MERKILAWLAMAVSLVVWFPCAGILALGAVWSAALSVMSSQAIKDFLGPGIPPAQFWGIVAVPVAIIGFVALVLGLVFLIWGARTVVRARPEEKPTTTD